MAVKRLKPIRPWKRRPASGGTRAATSTALARSPRRLGVVVAAVRRQVLLVRRLRLLLHRDPGGELRRSDDLAGLGHVPVPEPAQLRAADREASELARVD